MSDPSLSVHLEDGLPCLVSHAGRTYYVLRILSTWTRTWWWGADRTYFEVETNAGTLEIYLAGRLWYLSGAIAAEADDEIIGVVPVAV